MRSLETPQGDAVGRLGAPLFFFLIGYARSRKVPLHWIGLGITLTLLDSWNNQWNWMALNILLSFSLIRLVRPWFETLIKAYRWHAFLAVIGIFLAVLPFVVDVFDYGVEGWLWALFGLCQRMYVERSLLVDDHEASMSSRTEVHKVPISIGLMRLVACFVASIVYLWQEQIEFSFNEVQFAFFFLGTVLVSWTLYLFQRAPSGVQPVKYVSSILRFCGRHSMGLYAVPLAGFELIIGLMPQLAG